MEKLVVVIMGQNCEKFLPMCLESIKDADAIVYCDGGSTDQSRGIAVSYGAIVKYQEYNQEDKQMNGKQRNYYLEYIKQRYPNDWCLVLDADEVVEDLETIKQFVQEAKPGLYSPRMRHFIGDLSKEDATQPTHYCLNRLFKISEAGNYPLTEHPVLQFKQEEGKEYIHYSLRGITIWHLGYVNGIFDVHKKYQNHMKKSEMHTPEYLYSWNMSHILGGYPTTPINVMEVPEIILNNFGIDKDVFYFANRGLNTTNFLMVRDIMSLNPSSVLDLGCGLGNHGFVFTKFYGVKYKGMDISNFAVKTNPYKLNLTRGNIKNYQDTETYDVVLCLDILEHLTEEELDETLKNIVKFGKTFVFSIPFIGDPNLKNDPTHKIHQTKEWWLLKFKPFFKIRDCPNWAFSNQMLIGEKI